MGLIAITGSFKNFGKAIYNVFIIRTVDNDVRKIKGQKWVEWKNEQTLFRSL